MTRRRQPRFPDLVSPNRKERGETETRRPCATVNLVCHLHEEVCLPHHHHRDTSGRYTPSQGPKGPRAPNVPNLHGRLTGQRSGRLFRRHTHLSAESEVSGETLWLPMQIDDPSTQQCRASNVSMNSYNRRKKPASEILEWMNTQRREMQQTPNPAY